MRLLVLSSYYPPDLSAGSFRVGSLVSALQEQLPAGSHLDIVTTLPNRYQTFNQQAPEHEIGAGIEIHRIRLPSHRSDMAGQSRAYSRYALQVLRHVRGKRYDAVFATSGRLMTAALAASVARLKSIPLYLDLRDIFVDTMQDLLPGVTRSAVRGVFGAVESWTMRRAARINLVSPGFRDYFERRYPGRSFSFFTNGIDDEFLGEVVQTSTPPGRPATILYAGNLGEGQCLHLILPGLATAMKHRARFVVIGDGGRSEMLQNALAAAGADNVELRPPVARAELLSAYQSADVLFLHLGAYPAFEKVLPSKLFEYAAMGKPVLAGVAGYAARFVREEISNAAVFSPCDVAGAVAAFDSLELVTRPRAEFVARHARRAIAAKMASDILAIVRDGGATGAR